MLTTNSLHINSILQKFAVNDEVIVTVQFELSPPRTMRKLHARYTDSYRVLRRIASIIYELNVTWNFCISPVFGGEDSTLFDACTLLHLLLTTADPLQRLVSPPPCSDLMHECWL